MILSKQNLWKKKDDWNSHSRKRTEGVWRGGTNGQGASLGWSRYIVVKRGDHIVFIGFEGKMITFERHWHGRCVKDGTSDEEKGAVGGLGRGLPWSLKVGSWSKNSNRTWADNDNNWGKLEDNNAETTHPRAPTTRRGESQGDGEGSRSFRLECGC